MDWKALIAKIAPMADVEQAVQHMLEAIATEFKKLFEHSPATAANAAQEMHNEASNLAQAAVAQPAKASAPTPTAKTKGGAF